MSRIWQIAWREYLENVRTKAFLVGVILTPLWFGLVFLVPFLAERQEMEGQHVVIVDETGILGGPLQVRLEQQENRKQQPKYVVEQRNPLGAWDATEEGPSLVDQLQQRAADGDLIVVVLTPPILEKRKPQPGERASAVLHAASVGGADVAREVAKAVDGVVNDHVMKEREIDAEDAKILRKPALETTTPLSRSGERGGGAQAITPFIFMMFLFMGIVGISQMLVNSTIEEKASRVYELLLSSVSPFQLMAGKIIGICGVGFTLMALWVGGGLIAANLQGIGGIVTGAQLGLFVTYYLLGFTLIASLMVAVGSACNTLKEAQNMMAPVSLLLALPLLVSLLIMKEPNGTFATVASFFPPWTPFLMMARIAAVPGPPTWQVVTSILLLIVGTYIAVRFAARVFRVGILMYGKPPSLGEVFRWMRTGS